MATAVDVGDQAGATQGTDALKAGGQNLARSAVALIPRKLVAFIKAPLLRVDPRRAEGIVREGLVESAGRRDPDQPRHCAFEARRAGEQNQATGGGGRVLSLSAAGMYSRAGAAAVGDYAEQPRHRD